MPGLVRRTRGYNFTFYTEWTPPPKCCPKGLTQCSPLDHARGLWPPSHCTLNGTIATRGHGYVHKKWCVCLSKNRIKSLRASNLRRNECSIVNEYNKKICMQRKKCLENLRRMWSYVKNKSTTRLERKSKQVDKFDEYCLRASSWKRKMTIRIHFASYTSTIILSNVVWQNVNL